MADLLYVSCADARVIEILELDAEGGLRRRATVEVPGPDASTTSMPLALSADRQRLYAAVRSAPYPLASFAVAGDGGLALLGTTELPAAMAYISVAGRHLLSASYPGSLIASHPIGADGVVHGPANQVTPTPDKAHCIVTDASGRHVYVPCLGGDVILHLTLDQATGQMTERGRVAVRSGAGPRHLVFGRGGNFAYVVNELDASIDTYGFDPATGELSLCQTVQQLPDGAAGRIAAADIHITPDGRFLYASERLTNILTAWRIDAATGLLQKIGSVASEAAPRGFAIAPNGRFLLCAGQTSHRVGVYAIDQEGGALTPLGGLDVAANPNWIEFPGGLSN